MKILDIRGNLIKIESSKPIQVSSLLKIFSDNNEYLAQVLYAEHAGIANIVFAKVLSDFCEPLQPKDINSVSKEATCEKIKLADVITNFGEKQDIVLGELAYENFIPTADRSFFDKKVLIVSENNKCSDMLINNFAHQIKNIGSKIIVLDTEGTCDGIKLTAGLDFKLPLNEHSINFIYEKYFSDITDESKALISDIFNELKEYAGTVPYIPFKTFKSVIDEVLDYSQNLSLYFFKTKLDKLYEAGVFANSHEEVMDWSSISELRAASIVVDLSKIHKIFVPEYISLITNAFNNTEEKIYAMLKLDENIADKDLIKDIIENKNVLTSCIVRSNFKYIQALKQNSSSFLIMGGIRKSENFDYCKFLLKNLPVDKYVITGEFTSPISLIFQLKEITDTVPQTAKNVISEVKETTVIEETVEEYEPMESSDVPLIDDSNNAEETETPEVLAAYEQIEEPIEESLTIESPIEDYNPDTNKAEDSVENIETVLEYETIENLDEDNEITEEIQEYTKPFSTESEAVIEHVDEIFTSDEIVVETEEELELTTSETQEFQPRIQEEEDSFSNNLETELLEPTINEDELSELAIEEPTTEEDLSLAEDFSLEEEPIKTEEELLDEQIRRDVDRVYMATSNEEAETLSEDDLDFIEELVGNEELIIEELPEPGAEPLELIEEDENLPPESVILEESTNITDTIQAEEPVIPTINTATPTVPIYAAEIAPEAIVQSDPIQQGDRVIHVKFGIGIVEKIFNYGTKNFCSINFENIGRKVLDPNVTELKKA